MIKQKTFSLLLSQGKSFLKEQGVWNKYQRTRHILEKNFFIFVFKRRKNIFKSDLQDIPEHIVFPLVFKKLIFV